MFDMVFKMFLVCFLLTAAVSGFLDRKNAVYALYARCLSVICVVIVLLSGVGLFATGNWDTVTNYLGSVPIVIFCFVAAFLVWKKPKGDVDDNLGSELTEDKPTDNPEEIESEYSEEDFWENEDIYEMYAESQTDKELPSGQKEDLKSPNQKNEAEV